MSLSVRGLVAGYGPVTVLREVSLEVEVGRILALVGANGAGKSTLLRCLAGLHPARAGAVLLDGVDVTGLPAHRRARLGLALVPEGRQLFVGLTVAENLRLGLHGLARPDSTEGRRRLDRCFDLFPALRELSRRPAGVLSGGQQQMLAVARALVREPRVLMLDEPSLGLAPMAARAVLEALSALRGEGVAVLLVEQNATAALEIADRGAVVELGRVGPVRPAAELLRDPEVGSRYLGAAPEGAVGRTGRRLEGVIGHPLLPSSTSSP
ncbi:MAG TPA: ABC transporter ATP-binding protein [Candidatus Dormibacteraeota bacterium]|nr:ABC transporter ATP-binding protein [Candidatus Dormibacteraeota bacterium]